METRAQTFLKQEYLRRKQKNSLYSIRSFANWLGMSPAQMSQLISGKRRLTRKMALKIVDRFTFSPREKMEFLESLDPDLEEDKLRLNSEKVKLREDEFALIADWEHLALLSLAQTNEVSKDPRWLARRLGVTVERARECFERLVRMKLISVEGPQFRRSTAPLQTSSDRVSPAIQKHHRQNLKIAEQKLDVPVELREFSSITMAMNPAKMEKAKEMIRDFKRKLCDLLEEGPKEEVYTLSLQLFPNTILKEEVSYESD